MEPLAGTGTTPATITRLEGAPPAPVVVIAHGFAGSRQLMESYAFSLARAGYVAVSFDFEGHGRNPVAMSGDVTSVEGTTRLLMAETGRVADAALAVPHANGQLALLGHSMASDIIVRQALADPRVRAVVGISTFSEAVTPGAPGNFLMIAGSWEGFLAAEAERVLQLADPAVQMGQTAGDPALGTGRRAVLAPGVEHVGVLYSATALREALGWLDAVFGRQSPPDAVVMRGGWIALLLAGIVALAWPLAALARPAGAPVAAGPPLLARGRFWVAALLPAGLTPLLLAPFDTRFLPVLVADYLALHFAVYGALVLGLLALWGQLGGARGGQVARGALVAAAVAGYGLFVFGAAMDRYVTSFFPHPGRAAIIAAMAAGAVPYMLSEALLAERGGAPFWRGLVARGAFLLSLGLAVALDPERLFFLLIILPVVLLFFVLFGAMGGWVARASGRAGAAGVGLGLFLAWALGVVFPLFQAG